MKQPRLAVNHIYRANPTTRPSGAGPAWHGHRRHHHGHQRTFHSSGGIRAFLRNKAGQQVLLEVKTSDGGAARPVIVKPISSEREADLRYDEWELTRRERVEELGQGQIGYVHLRAMGPGDIAQWARAFFPVFQRQGLIIDVRHNRGGNIDSWILEKLLRRAWFYWQPRLGRPYWNMHQAFRATSRCCVTNATASDGEASRRASAPRPGQVFARARGR
jgi:tricorn protease